MPIIYDENGITIQTQSEIVTEREDALKPVLGSDFSIEGDSVVGNLQASDTDRELDIQECLSFLVSQMSLSNASGLFLDFYSQFKSLTRNSSSKAIIQRTIKGTSGTTISSGGLIINNNVLDIEFILIEDILINSVGEATAQFEATVFGALNLTDAQTYSIVNPVSNITNVIFVTGDGLISNGEDAESDEDFRQRIQTTSNINSVGITSAIVSQILALDGVSASFYIENKSSTDWTYENWVTSTHTITATANSYNLAGSGTLFLTDLNTNYQLKYEDDSSDEQLLVVSTITSDTALISRDKILTAVTGSTYSYAMPVLPPNSFEIIVLGGNEVKIAETIFYNQVPTTETIGNTSVLVTDSEGYSEIVKFTRPTQVDIDLKADVYYTVALLDDEKTALKQTMVDYWNSLKSANISKGIGLDVDSLDFGYLSNTNSKIRKIRNIEIKKSIDSIFTDYISIGNREIANILIDDISLTYIAS